MRLQDAAFLSVSEQQPGSSRSSTGNARKDGVAAGAATPAGRIQAFLGLKRGTGRWVLLDLLLAGIYVGLHSVVLLYQVRLVLVVVLLYWLVGGWLVGVCFLLLP